MIIFMRHTKFIIMIRMADAKSQVPLTKIIYKYLHINKIGMYVCIRYKKTALSILSAYGCIRGTYRVSRKST